MSNDTRTLSARTRVSVALSPGHSVDPLRAGSSDPPSHTPATSSIVFPVSAIALDDHPRLNSWAGLAEAGQILAEAEARKCTPLSQEDLRALLDLHLDAYDPTWNFERRGISDAWIAGFCHTFALYAQQCVRLRHSEPIYGIGLVGCPEAATSPSRGTEPPCTLVRFRHTTIQVADALAFWEGIWEGQLAALDEQPAWQKSGMVSPPLTSARFCDDLLDLVVELGNHDLDFVTGYVLGYSEGLLCGRTNPPAKMQAEHASASAGSGENS